MEKRGDLENKRQHAQMCLTFPSGAACGFKARLPRPFCNPSGRASKASVQPFGDAHTILSSKAALITLASQALPLPDLAAKEAEVFPELLASAWKAPRARGDSQPGWLALKDTPAGPRKGSRRPAREPGVGECPRGTDGQRFLRGVHRGSAPPPLMTGMGFCAPRVLAGSGGHGHGADSPPALAAPWPPAGQDPRHIQTHPKPAALASDTQTGSGPGPAPPSSARPFCPPAVSRGICNAARFREARLGRGARPAEKQQDVATADGSRERVPGGQCLSFFSFFNRKVGSEGILSLPTHPCPTNVAHFSLTLQCSLVPKRAVYQAGAVDTHGLVHRALGPVPDPLRPSSAKPSAPQARTPHPHPRPPVGPSVPLLCN